MEPDVAARTLRLLTLLQVRTTWTAAELVERTGVSARTLRRDLERLAALGYEIIGKPGPGGHYRLAPGTRMPPLVFDDDEVVALVAGLRMAEQGAAAEAAARALVKLRQVLPRRLAELADDIAANSETLILDEPPTEDRLGPLTAAAAANLGVAFSYTDQHGTISQRSVDSVRCLYVRGRWNVLAFDHTRDDWRVFRLDRMRQLTTTGTSARRDPPADDLATWLRTDFGRLNREAQPNSSRKSLSPILQDMAEPRRLEQRIADTLRRFETDVDAWVASASDDCSWLVPLSFVWHENRLLFATSASTRTANNVTATSKVRVALGHTRDVVMVDGDATITASADLTEAEVSAYECRHGSDPRTWSDAVIRVTPVRIQAWREDNEQEGRQLMRAGAWLL